MKALAIAVDVPDKYLRTTEDRDPLHVGQKLTGTVSLDEPRRPKQCEIRWVDAHGRVLGRTAGTYVARQRHIRFEFDLHHSWFPIHYIECELEGQVQQARARFIVRPQTDGWETLPAVTWAIYPYGEFYDQLQAVGVNGVLAYKMLHYDNVVEHGMRCYVDQMTFDEISIYHRPYKLFWEPPADFKDTPQAGRHFRQHWKTLLEKYKRARAACGKEGISRNDHYRKLLWRAHCPNDPGTVAIAGERFAAGVRQHKPMRPLFYNIADEAGITDQTSPFDFCYCPYCMDKFRQWLEARYGTLADLNREWGTDFTNWDLVYPLTCDETMDRVKRGEPLNFASWADHREFMDDTFADFFAEMRRVGLEVDPQGYFSTGGTQWPTIYGGWDYTKLTRAVDVLIPYNIGGNQELIRSIAPDVKNISPYFGDDERLVRQMWYSAIHGDAAFIFWDHDEPNGRFVERPSGRLSRRGKRFGPALREIRGGLGRQLALWWRADDPIGLLYSQPTERAHWMLEALDDRKEMEWFDRVYRSRYVNVRQSWQRLIEDRQLQYRYISYLDLQEGRADLSQFKLVILPETLALSETEAEALREYVHAGGVLVADGRVGRMAANCRQAEGGLLDDLFGVRQEGAVTLKTGAALNLACAGDQTWHALGKELAALNALDGSLRLAPSSDADVAARAGRAPAVICRQFGEGLAVYLNADLSHYERDRYSLTKDRAVAARSLMDLLADLADIEPAVAVTDRTLGSTAGIEATRFAQRGAELHAFIMNRPWSISGVGEKLDDDTLAVFETDRDLELAFQDPAHTYNARTGTYLGETAEVRQTLPRLTPLFISRLPYRVKGLDVTCPKETRRGEAVEVAVALKADGPAVDHVVRLDVYQPDGTWCYWLSTDTVARAGRGTFTVTLALNDPEGPWRLELKDCVTGMTAKRRLNVR